MTAKKNATPPAPEAMEDTAVPPVVEEDTTTPVQEGYEGFADIIAGRTVLASSPTVVGAKVLPRIIGGKVEFDGLDYRESPIYRHLDVHCSYCGNSPRPDRITHAYIADTDPDHVIFVCSDYSCTDSHRKKFTAEGSILPGGQA